jgi:biotin synthase
MNADERRYGNCGSERRRDAGASAFGTAAIPSSSRLVADMEDDIAASTQKRKELGEKPTTFPLDSGSPSVSPCLRGGRPPCRRESPEYVRLSSAAAMTLGLKPGRFHRNAKLHCLNVLLTYEDGCLGRCAYCGLARTTRRSAARQPPLAGVGLGAADGRRTVVTQSFIRVEWPTHSTDEILERMRPAPPQIERVCISMVTRRRAVEDVKAVSRRIREVTDVPISFLVAPTLIPSADYEKEFTAFRDAGAGWVGIAIDAATHELFDRYRGSGVGGPHGWDRYWDAVAAAVRVFGEGRAGVHLIVGLGESEREMVETIQRARDLGARTHLFSFFPEDGTALVEHPQPSVGRYRRVQLARFLVDEGLATAREMSFDERGRIAGLGADEASLEQAIASGLPFRTSGCPGKSVARCGSREVEVGACNRPYANCLPGSEIRNFPFQPDEDDIELVRRQLEA